MTPIAAALLSALLLVAAFPPIGLGALGLVAPMPWLFALRRVERLSHALGVGFLIGFVFFGVTLRWVMVIGAVAWLPLTIWLAATMAVASGVIWSFRLWPPTRWWLITTGVVVLWELVRATFPFGGFPWGQIGYAVGSVPGFIGAVQWIGPSGWTVLSVALSAGAILLFEDRNNWRMFVDPVVVGLLLAIAGGLFAPSADGTELRVAVIQGNSPCPGTRCQNENQRIYESHLELTRTLTEGARDLVVWAENSTGPPFDPLSNPQVASQLADEAARIEAYLLVSGTRIEGVGPDEFLNVNMLWDRNGRFVGEYAKRHPVPFGEYVPLRATLDFIPQLERVPRDMVRGAGPVVFDTPDGPIGSVISFEGAFSRIVRSEAQEGARLMIVATNEASFGTGPASDQLIALVKVNAAAIGQDVVHAAITGKSTVIRANGTVGETTELFTRDLLLDRVAFREAGPTIYTRFGDWLLLVAIAAGIGAATAPGEGVPTRRQD